MTTHYKQEILESLAKDNKYLDKYFLYFCGALKNVIIRKIKKLIDNWGKVKEKFKVLHIRKSK